MKSVLKKVMICIFIFSFITGCATSSIKDDLELNALIKAFAEHNIEMEKKWVASRGEGLKTLTVEKSGKDFAVSAELDKAFISEVVGRVLDESGMPYLFDQVRLHGNITARFNNKPLTDALNIILKPILLSAKQEDGMVVISGAAGDDPEAKVKAKVSMKNLDMTTALELLSGTFPMNQNEGKREVDYGSVPGTNTLYLRGTKNKVFQAAQMLTEADQEIKHVVIEVLVVEFASGALERLGTNVMQLADGRYQGIDIKNGASSISFIKDASDATKHLTSFTATVEMLVNNGDARLISRPFLSTLSGKEAEINITTSQYVKVEEDGSTTTQSIEAGVSLKITPTVGPDNMLNMVVYVEDSQFSRGTVEDVLTQVNKNSASTTMHVKDGQTIRIGGLILNRETQTNSGFPFLRHVPIINLLFATRGSEIEKKEVAIYITPHIWKPNIISPMIAPDALTIEEGKKGVGAFIDRIK